MGGGSSRHDDVPLDLPQQEVVSLSGGAAGAHIPSGGSLPPRVVVPPSAQHQTTEQVKIQLVWDKASFRLERVASSKHLWQLSADFNAEVPCEFSVHFHCKEEVNGGLLQYAPVDGSAPPTFALKFPAGKHTARLDGDRAIDLKRYPLEVFWKYKKRHADVLPIVLSLFDASKRVQSVVYLTLEVPGTRAAGEADLRCTMLKQKVFVGGNEYTLQEVYGIADLGKDEAHDESAVGDPCVICLTDPRNTAVLPCRHLCVCEDCARQLQVGAATRNDHCPICRGNITGMQVFDVKK